MPVIEVIKYEPRESSSVDIISYKHECEDFSCKAQLLVAPSQIALFVNEGEVIPFLPGHYTLDESNNSMWGFVNKWKRMFSGGVSSFHCSVYFINLTTLMDVRFGTQTPIQMEDPVEGVNIHVRAAGLFGAHINNDDKDGKEVIKFFNKVVGTREIFTKDDLSAYLRGKIIENITDELGKVMGEKNIGILKVASHYSEISSTLFDRMKPWFADFGIALDNFSFMTINVPDEDIAEINEMKIQARRRVMEAQANAAAMTTESEALAAKRAREGYSYQQEKGMDVLKTAAGNEAQPGAFMGMGMGLGMGAGMGVAVGGAMGDMAKNTLGSMNQAPQQSVPTGTNKCPKCGAELAAGAKFCPNCGNKVGNFCPKCGAELAPGAKFCPNCGNKLTKNCSNCGAELAPDAKFCPNCGTKCE